LEIHLATGFQNIYMDHAQFPADLKEKIYRFLDKNNADERKPSQTDAQFYYGTRKKAIGPFKPELWGMDEAAKTAVFQTLEEQFVFFYEKLNVVNTKDVVAKFVKPVEYHQPMPASARAAGDDLGLAD
jgi:fructose-bisphosphate aldolase, class II